MRKYIDRKLYDTETAHLVGHWDNGLYATDLDYEDGELYRKRTGEYFFVGSGGARSVYAEAVGDGMGPGSAIKPVTAEWARDWAERNLTADEVEAEWGASEEPESVNVWVSGEAKRRLLDECARTGETQAQAVERLLMGL